MHFHETQELRTLIQTDSQDSLNKFIRIEYHINPTILLGLSKYEFSLTMSKSKSCDIMRPRSRSDDSSRRKPKLSQ